MSLAADNREARLTDHGYHAQSLSELQAGYWKDPKKQGACIKNVLRNAKDLKGIGRPRRVIGVSHTSAHLKPDKHTYSMKNPWEQVASPTTSVTFVSGYESDSISKDSRMYCHICCCSKHITSEYFHLKQSVQFLKASKRSYKLSSRANVDHRMQIPYSASSQFQTP